MEHGVDPLVKIGGQKIDHNSLKYFLDKKDLNERQHKWVRKIHAYDF